MVQLIPEIVLMGGGHYCGNITPLAEFNIWADPEAARVVFTCGIPRLTIVPLDATHRALLTLADCDALDALGATAGGWKVARTGNPRPHPFGSVYLVNDASARTRRNPVRRGCHPHGPSARAVPFGNFGHDVQLLSNR